MPQFEEPVEILDDEGDVRIRLRGEGAYADFYNLSLRLRASLSPFGFSVGGVPTGGIGALETAPEHVGVLGEGDVFDPIVAVSIGGLGTRGRLEMVDDSDNVTVRLDGSTGDVELLGGDCAEDFELDPSVPTEPGMVMVIGEDARLRPCVLPHDRRVAGVLSGAGNLRPGLILGRSAARNGAPLALSGRVHCRVDARYGAVSVGDLLTTSATTGHAMRVSEHVQAVGAVVGKALEPQREGTGLVQVLVTLQ